MLERPTLPDSRVIDCLRRAYGISPLRLEFLPLGNDFRAWSYRVDTRDAGYFVKLRRCAPKAAALHAPRYLRGLGIRHVVAPLPALSGDLTAQIDSDFWLTVYPYIEGESAWNLTLTAAQWRDWGRIMRAIHAAPLPAHLNDIVQREAFGEKWLRQIETVESAIDAGDFEGEIADAVAASWRGNADAIAMCRQRYQALGAELTAQNPRLRFCHADIHRANIIIDADGSIQIVDWDDTLLAPIERDLMFFLGDGHAPDSEAAFLAGYGDCQINAAALAYYRYDWTLQEFADYGLRVFLSSGVSAAELDLARREFARLFAPGDVVERAHQAYARIPH